MHRAGDKGQIIKMSKQSHKLTQNNSKKSTSLHYTTKQPKKQALSLSLSLNQGKNEA